MITKFNSFLNESIMNIISLSNIVARTGQEKDTILAILRNEFKRGGDESVIKAFKEMTNIDIEPVRKGIYILK
jgi:hypothetical protein